MNTGDFISWLGQLDIASGGLLVVNRDVQFDSQQFLRNIKRAGLVIVPSMDGPISIVQDGDDPKDFSRQSGAFPLHTDGLYYPRVPEFLLLFCENPGEGNTPTLVSDTRPLVRQYEVRRTVLSDLDLVYVGRDGRCFPRPLVERHPITYEPIMNLGARAFLRLKEGRHRYAGLTRNRAARLAIALRRRLEQSVSLRHFWAAGDALILDNNSYVHGREAAEGRDPRRRLIRVWMNRSPAPAVPPTVV